VGVRALATDWPPTGHTLRGGTPLPPHWPLTGHWLHHTGSGEPLSGHRAKTPLANFGHTLREAPLQGQRGPASPLPGQREPHHDRPPTGQTGRPTRAPYRPSDAPPGPMATASLTGHLLATYWPSGRPPTGHRLATKGRPSAGGLRTAPLWPPTGHKGTGRGRLRPALPPTGHLRPTWPSEAFGHLLPLPHTSR